MLDSKSGLDCPLSFGNKDAPPLEDTQLEHVMQGRSDTRFKGTSATRGSISVKAIDPGSPTLAHRASKVTSSSGSDPIGVDVQEPVHRSWCPHEDLSVERYEALTGNGDAMAARHLAELSQILGEEADPAQPESA